VQVHLVQVHLVLAHLVPDHLGVQLHQINGIQTTTLNFHKESVLTRPPFPAADRHMIRELIVVEKHTLAKPLMYV